MAATATTLKLRGKAGPTADPFALEMEAVRLQVARHALKIVQNQTNYYDLLARDPLLRSQLDPPTRNLDAECGYPVRGATAKQYEEMYRFNSLAGRVVNALPDACWLAPPEVYEDEDPTRLTPFEQDFQQVLARFPTLWHTLLRTDRESRYGSYGGLLVGVKDNRASTDPVGKVKGPQDLLFLVPLGEADLNIAVTDGDTNSPRFGRPAEYQVTVGDGRRDGGEAVAVPVHWSRVVPLADNLGPGVGVYGRSALEPVFNRLLDLRKVLAASAEMYWKGAFPGISFETLAEVVGRANMNKATLQQEYANYQNGSQRGLFLDGVHANQLAPAVADPTAFVAAQVKVIAADTDIPEQVLMGSQLGKQAGGENMTRWQGQVRGRRDGHLTPNLVLPLIDLFVRAGVCRPPQKPVQVWWPDVDLSSPKDKADVAVKLSQALLQYVTSGAELVMPVQFFLEEVLKLPAPLVKRITALTGQAPKTKAAWKDPKANGSGAGKADASRKRGGTSRNGAASRKGKK